MGFLAVRMLGLVVLVPLIEELFYRSFLMRWVVDPNYTRVPIGRVTPLGLAATTGVFAFSHPEWLPALLTGLAWGWLVGPDQERLGLRGQPRRRPTWRWGSM